MLSDCPILITIPTRASIQRLYPDQRKNIKAYLDENRIDFESKPDLIKLLTFCDEMTKGDRN